MVRLRSSTFTGTSKKANPSPAQHNGNPNRYSTYSNATSTHTRSSTLTATFDNIEDGLRRLEDARLQKQRFVVSEQKSELISKLALSAKLERALRWRLSTQDAERRVVKKEESKQAESKVDEKLSEKN